MAQPKPIAPELAVMGQIDQTDIRRLAELGYRTIINNRPEGEEAGQLPTDEARAEAARLGLNYVYLPVRTDSITRDDVAAHMAAVRENPKPVVAHCRSGTRSYLLWAAGQVLSGERDSQSIMDQAAAEGFDLRALPGLVARLKTS